MTSISQQTKDGLIVAVTVGVGLATGFFVDAWSKHENFILPLAALVVLGVAQLFLAFAKSTDMADLEEYRKGDMANLKIRNAMAEKVRMLVEEGKLTEALDWHNAARKIGTGRKPQ